MSAQYDVLPGFDLSSVTSPTRTQHIQAISQIAPLSNIGFVIWQAGTSLNTTIAQGTGGSPDVTNNPRFARYIWLNTFSAASAAPTPYFYDASTGNWTSTNVAAGSIVDASVSATAEIQVSKLKDGNANEVIVTDGAGTGVQWSSVATLLAALNDSVPLTAIDDSAAVGPTSFLRREGSALVWKTFTQTVTDLQAAFSAVPPSTLAPGSNNTILGTNGSGAVAFDTPANILANGAITLALISDGGGSALQVLARNSGNTAWSPQTLNIAILSSAAISSSGTDSTAGGTGTMANIVHTIPHGLGALPKLVDARIVCTTGELGYSIGDEVSVASVRDNNAGNGPAFAVVVDATNITVLNSSTGAGTPQIPNKGTGVHATLTDANWKVKAYAWK